MAEELIGALGDFFASSWHAAIPLVGFIVVAAVSAGATSAGPSRDRREPSAGGSAWPAIPAISLVAFTIWCALGNYQGSVRALAAFTVGATACGVVAANRDLVREWISGDGSLLRISVRDATLLLVAVVSTVCALEVSWNDTFPALDARALAIEVALVACIIGALYFLAQRSGRLAWVAVVLAAMAGTAEYFLVKFKGVSLLPSDLLALPTAFRVKEGYAFVLYGSSLKGPLATCVAITALALLGGVTKPDERDLRALSGRHSAHLLAPAEEVGPELRRKDRIRHFLANLGTGLAFCGAAVALMVGPNYIHGVGLEFDYGNTAGTYKTNGFLTSFVAAAQDLPIAAPAGYTRAKAAELQVSLNKRYEEELATSERRLSAEAQFAEERPSIIVVMNESFADLSVFNGLGAGYGGPTYFNSVSDALMRGNLGVSVLGGGTCNTEFEFLTGNSYAFIGAGKYPYIMYRMRCENLASQLSSAGYTTHAIHPNDPTNWNRDVVYDRMGFDEFVDISAFEDAPQLHMGVTDAATYDKILEILALDPSPQFVFDVTMQNHGSYNLANIPEDKQVAYEFEGLADGSVTQEDADATNEYLACITASDADLQAFMERLSLLDRRVVLVFFGDHQPSFTSVYNDLYFTDEDPFTHEGRLYRSSYLIWANYDVAGIDQASQVEGMSADMLGAVTLDLVGAPLSSYQKARLVLRSDGIEAANIFGWEDAEGSWWKATDTTADGRDLYEALGMVNYLNFGSTVTAIP